MTKDVDILGTRSKFVEFKTKKLANYTLCKTNRVLTIDDISPLFSEAGTQYPYVDFSIEEGYSRFLVQVINPATNDIESTEFITFGDDESTFVLEKGSVSNSSEKLGILSTINNVCAISFISSGLKRLFCSILYTFIGRFGVDGMC